jgi:hypothetical protein
MVTSSKWLYEQMWKGQFLFLFQSNLEITYFSDVHIDRPSQKLGMGGLK